MLWDMATINTQEVGRGSPVACPAVPSLYLSERIPCLAPIALGVELKPCQDD